MKRDNVNNFTWAIQQLNILIVQHQDCVQDRETISKFYNMCNAKTIKADIG